MLIVKVMVCFLAIFGREDCRLVGGLPVVQSPPDSGERVEDIPATAVVVGIGDGSSNQRIANEPAATTTTTTTTVAATTTTAMMMETTMVTRRRRTKCHEEESEDKKLIGNDFSGVEKTLEKESNFESGKTRNNDTSKRSGIDRFSSVYRSSDSIDEEDSGKKKRDFKNVFTANLADALRNGVMKRHNRGIEDDESTVENRRRKNIKDPELFAAHQQTTNMRPIRIQHAVVQEKRNVKDEGRGFRKIRRNFNPDKSISENAAKAYSYRGNGNGNMELDLSRALYQFGPAQLHALKGVFDKVPPPRKNFKPIPAKEVAYIPPRIIYETKLIPAPFAALSTEQKTVDALSALLGKSPDQQLKGLNLILGKNRAEESLGSELNSREEVSRGGDTDRQSFVTPIPSVDINEGLVDGSFRFSHNDAIDNDENIETGYENPFDREQTRNENPTKDNNNHYNINHNDNHNHNYQNSEDFINPSSGNGYKTIIPIVETPQETLPPSQPPAIFQHEERRPVLENTGAVETSFENSGRYPNHKEEGVGGGQGGSDDGNGYAAKYSFGYHVKDYDTENNFGHEEERDGVITNGRYYVLLPDGRVQNVKYHVDEGGYHAKVSYQLNRSR